LKKLLSLIAFSILLLVPIGAQNVFADQAIFISISCSLSGMCRRLKGRQGFYAGRGGCKWHIVGPCSRLCFQSIIVFLNIHHSL